MRDSKHRVMVVDDDPDILDLLKYNLWKEGYKVKAVDASDHAIKAAKSFSPDLIVLDLMMPAPNGIELCRELRSMRQFRNTYIFFLTAKSESYYRQAALDTGADDYIEKVTGIRMLIQKIIAVLEKDYVIRRGERQLQAGGLLLDRTGNIVRIGDMVIQLSIPEFEVIFFLAQNKGKVFTPVNLLKSLWGSELYLSQSSLENYLHNLESKVGSRYIHRTVDGRYQFIA